MAATVIASLLLIGAAAVVGTAICRLGGLRESRGVAPAVGLATLMVIAAPAVRLPGGAASALAAIVVVAVAPLAARRVRAALLEGLGDQAVVTLGAVLTLCLPWLVAGRFGVLGMGLNNDTAAHLVAAQWLVDHRMPVADTLVGDGYPLGPHALAAALATAGVPLVAGFSAVAIVGPATAAVAALVGVPVSRRPLRWALALLVGLSYLTAAYFAQMAFKETIEASLVLAFALVLPAAARAALHGPRAAARAALPLAVLMAGTVQTMSWPGTLWPLATLAVWGALASARLRRAARPVAAALLSGAIAFALLISLEVPRIVSFQGSHYAHEPAEGLGNLARPLSPYETLGVWLSPDFRFASRLPLLSGALMIAAGLLAASGVLGWLRRRGDQPLAAAIVAGWLIWTLLTVAKNGYSAAKGLAIVSPLVALALVSGAAAAWRGPAAVRGAAQRRSELAVLHCAVLLPALPMAALVARTAATAVVLCAAAGSSAWALRDAPVGPDAHHRELRMLAASAPSGPMLVLDSSDFVAWDLYGVDVWRPPLIYVVHTAPTRPEKRHRGGQPFDLDSVSADTLNRFASVLTDRNAAGSVPPSGLRVLRRTRSFVLWERVGTVRRRETLGEGWQPGKILDCSKPSHRSISRLKGWAIVRPRPVIATATGWHGDARKAGSTATRTLSLPPGRWDLSLQYVSRNPIDLSVGGRITTLPANLDRLGPLFAAGTTLGGRREIRVRVHSASRLARLLGATAPTRAFDSYRHQPLGALVATRHRAPERVPLSQACGRYVDNYVLQ
jgi:hypothetical protein